MQHRHPAAAARLAAVIAPCPRRQFEAAGRRAGLRERPVAFALEVFDRRDQSLL
jgi:hypothetical protein